MAAGSTREAVDGGAQSSRKRVQGMHMPVRSMHVAGWLHALACGCQKKKSGDAPGRGGPKEQGEVARLKPGVTEIHRSGLERTRSKNYNHNQTKTKLTSRGGSTAERRSSCSHLPLTHRRVARTRQGPLRRLEATRAPPSFPHHGLRGFGGSSVSDWREALHR